MKWFLGIFALFGLSLWITLEYVFPRPEGHWHLVLDNYEDTGQFESLDFSGSQITAGNVIYEYEGGVDRFQKKIRVWPMCRGLEPYYHFSGDSLILTQDDNRYFALKVDRSQCTQQSHFFETSVLNVDLSETSDTTNFLKMQKFSLINGIEVGLRKRGELDSMKICTFAGEKEISANNIDWLIEAHRITAVEKFHDKIQLAFYADKNTKVKHVKPILQKLSQIERPKVVLVFQYNPRPDAFELFGKEIIFEGIDWAKIDEEVLFSEYVLRQNRSK